jgi:L-aminopeptidase/D-esterase-like protein
VGKIYRNEVMMKSGIGSASFIGENGLVVAVIVVVNAFGNIRDSKGRILAGPLINNEPQDTIKLMEANLSNSFKYNMDNTTLAVVGTNAKLTKAQCNYLSQVAAHGLIRTISPVCTTVDGDTIFAFSKGTMQCDINILGALASKVLSEAIENAVKGADEVAGIKSYKSLI